MKKLTATLGLAFLVIMAMGRGVAAEEVVGVVKTLKGMAAIERNDKSVPAKIGDKLFEKDVIVTGKISSLGAILRDDSLISIGSNTRLAISRYIFKPADRNVSSVFKINKGTMTYLSGLIAKMDGKAVRVETPTASCGIRGTHLAVKVEDD
ncbi:MAG: hypothetical protein CSYNP_02080 [Syntrophus sp. SKADARSKE-3]|nr:hypothetical protein [Syntrophus sp. SKADARSKE-3]